MNTKLIMAVVRQLGYDRVDEEVKDYLKDVTKHGANGGFNGFIYYSDTISFFRKNKKLIVELAEDMAERIGEDVLPMINSFNCLKDYELSNSQIGKVLYGKFSNSGDNSTIMNALSWFALEEVARYVTEMDQEYSN